MTPKQETYENRIRVIANLLENLRVEIFQANILEDLREKQEFDNILFSLQSQIRNMANMIQDLD